MGGMSDDWEQTLAAVVAAGADAVEVGIPFSDPMMDGPVIQDAALLRVAARRRAGRGDRRDRPGRSTGPDRRDDVLQHCVPGRPQAHGPVAGRAGISGAILPDLPIEEIGPWAVEADAAGIDTVQLVAPSSPPERVERICSRARGFVYAVARMGVTGERSDLGSAAATVVERVRRYTDMPVCVGVGVSTPEQAAEVCQVADGVVVGSALVRRLLEGGGPGRCGRLRHVAPRRHRLAPDTERVHPWRGRARVGRPPWDGPPATRSA